METRTFTLDAGVLTRSEGDGRTISGIAVPYNQPALIHERGQRYTEQFAPGAFKDTIAVRGDRVKLYVNHGWQRGALPVGRAIVADHGNALGIQARIAETNDGRDVLALAHEDAVEGFSVGFEIPEGGVTWSADRSSRTVTRALLHEVSLAIGENPAYRGAVVESVRTEEVGEETEEIEEPKPDFAVRYRLELARLELVHKRIA